MKKYIWGLSLCLLGMGRPLLAGAEQRFKFELVAVFVWAMLLTGVPQAQAADFILFGVTGSGQLITIDPTTGAGTLVGNTGFSKLDTVELRADSSLVAVAGSHPAGGNQFIRIDPVTGAGSLIRTVVEYPFIEGLAFGNGVLYAAADKQNDGGAERLITIDPFTGIPTGEIGLFGINTPFFDDVDGLAISPTGALFGTDLQNKRLLSIDPITGAGTHIAFLSQFVAGLDFAPDGTLFGTTMSDIGFAGGASRLVTINTSTGAITDIGPIGFDNVWGIVFVPPAYSCTGFEPPFDVPILLKAKVNRAIPLEMQLFDDSTPITDLNIAGAAPVVNVSFSAGGGPAVDVTDQLAPLGQSSDGNEFRFDPLAGHWVYNLGTKPFTAAGTYTVTVAAGDTSYSISPTCTGQFVRSE